MTLIESIKQTLALADEYSPEAGYEEMFTEDEDFQNKTKILYGQAYQELSQLKKIKKVKTYQSGGSENTVKHYTAYSLPYDLYKIKNVIALDSETQEPIEGDFYIINSEKKIYINDADEITYKLEYYAYPQVINETTEDDFELEIDQDVQMLLAYKVTENILKTDPSADHTAFRQAYEDALQKLDLNDTGTMLSIKNKYSF